MAKELDVGDQTPTLSKEEALANLEISVHQLQQAGFRVGAMNLHPHNVPVVIVEGTRLEDGHLVPDDEEVDS
mgnify:CR=1 FL=1